MLVDLVLYAFEHGQNGDIFVQKAPAATIHVLAQALNTVIKCTRPSDFNYGYASW